MIELYLSHHGIKGQRWGIRRFQNEDGSLTKAGMRRYSEANEYTTRNGEKVTVLTSKSRKFETEVPDASGKKEHRSYSETVHTMYVNGKKTTIAYLDKDGDETNLNWISTKSKYEGKGYAQTMMNHLIKYSKDKNGSSFMSLEVPDDSPNAKHIYEKYGFKETGTSWDDYGLTQMKKNL